ncbi:MAG TPA: serine/threonine-protein kinase [Polyangiales bacterium]|nr:serine/threonine-protein kinase [Polyangiales bacterium]
MTSRPVPTAVPVDGALDPTASGEAHGTGQPTQPLSAAEQPLLVANRVIGAKYRLTRQIGHGGMGYVWEAEHEALARRVAVKFLKAWSHHDPSLPDRFAAEARLVAAIKHRFVVDVFDFGITDDGLYYMVLELLDGLTLAERMNQAPALSAREAIQLVADCLRGLHAVHEAGVVHRDLKPENIFVVHDADGMFPKLIDFGISKRAEAATVPANDTDRRKSRLTQPGTVVGTLSYMPPEQLRGRGDLDRRADVYSMGVILYELLAGKLPYEQDNVGDLMVEIMNAGPPPLSRVRPELGPELSNAIARALAPSADARFPTALALRDALLASLPKLPHHAMAGGVAKGAPVASGRGHETELQLAAAAAAFGGGSAVARWNRPTVWIGVGVATLLLIGGYLLSGPSAEPAAPAAAATAVKSSEAPPLTAAPAPQPALPEAPSVPEPVAAPAPVAKPASSPRAAPSAKPARKAASKRSAQSKPAHKKIYRELDF